MEERSARWQWSLFRAAVALSFLWPVSADRDRFFACEHETVIPHLPCLSKALSSDFSSSACVGNAVVVDAWGQTGGGNPAYQHLPRTPSRLADGLAGAQHASDMGIVGRGGMGVAGHLPERIRAAQLPGPCRAFSLRMKLQLPSS